MELTSRTRAAEVNLRNEGTFSSNENNEGIDDGLLMPVPNESGNGETPRRRGGSDFDPRNSPRPSLSPEEYPLTIPMPGHRHPLDVNMYATKKTVAQGMMDLALLTANANQLRYVLESGQVGALYYLSVSLIGTSIILQLATGAALIILGRYNLSQGEHTFKAERLNNWVILGVFFITIINVFIAAFGIDPVERVDPAVIVDATLRSMALESNI